MTDAVSSMIHTSGACTVITWEMVVVSCVKVDNYFVSACSANIVVRFHLADSYPEVRFHSTGPRWITAGVQNIQVGDSYCGRYLSLQVGSR